MFILLETPEGRPVLVNLDLVRRVDVSNHDEPLLYLTFQDGAFSKFRAVDGQGNPLGAGVEVTEQDLLRSFREMLAAARAVAT